MWYPSSKKTEDTAKEVNKNSSTTTILSTVGIFVLVVLSTISVFSYMRYNKLSRYLSDNEVKEFLEGRQMSQNVSEMQDFNTIGAEDTLKFLEEFRLEKRDLQIETENLLGFGNFGTVYKGFVKEKEAAIKQPKRDCSKGDFKSVLTEVKVLSHIGFHPNVMQFLGAYVKEINQGILLIATELCSNGSLDKYLRQKKHVVVNQDDHVYQNTDCNSILLFHDLNRFAMEIASGMDYIQRKHVVHGDLATRNVLLDEYLTCKISDFGLSRKLYEYQKYVKKSQEPLPWKWMAYESLVKMEFTSKSDVWSYGVTLWEIYSLGGIPYGGLNWTLDFVDKLRDGLRLTTPQYACAEIHEKILECWNLDPEQRPDFTTIVEYFKGLCDHQYGTL